MIIGRDNWVTMMCNPFQDLMKGYGMKSERTFLGIFFTLILAANLLGLRAASAALDPNTTVFLILMENHNWADFHGSSSAPYLNNTLLPMGSHAEQYYNPPGLHPSLPNYLWLEAGQNFGIFDDNDTFSHHQSTTSHLVTQLKNAGISWHAYQEDIPGTQCPLSNTGGYAVKHNPFIYFDDVTCVNNTGCAYCIANVRPFSQLATDLANHTVARYNFITPNLCNDGHDTCGPVNDAVRQTDNWLAANIPTILNSQAYQNGGVIIITWDEGEGGDGPIGMIVLSASAKGGGYNNSIHYTHSSTLRTIQEIYNVRPFLGDAANAADLSDLFVAGAIINTDPFVMDGVADSTNYLVNAGPMVIYAAVKGTTLYVATWSPGSNNNGANDHFVIVTDQLSPTLQAAFPTWSKTGMNAVDPSKPFLAGESINTYAGWQNTAAASQAFKAPTNSGLLEGTIDLVQAFGPNIMNGTVYVAAAAYSTNNGGALVAQGPPGNADPNIDASEFLALPVAAMLDNNNDGIFDRLQPGLGFVITNIQSAGSGHFTITWASVPGKTYQIQYSDALGSGWLDLPGGQVTGAAGQIFTSFTDATAGTQRFYRVKYSSP